jgi:hypothetical protein
MNSLNSSWSAIQDSDDLSDKNDSYKIFYDAQITDVLMQSFT